MTPEQHEWVLDLAGGADRAVVLERFGVGDGVALGFELLADAVGRRDGADVEYALIVCYVFGFDERHLPLLIELCPADWHRRHEDVVTALGRLRSVDSVEVLVEAAQWIPDYLDFDESRALATKAIWALGGIPGNAADAALQRLTGSPDVIVREGAVQQLERRSGRGATSCG